MKNKTKGIDTCDHCSGFWILGIGNHTVQEKLALYRKNVVKTLQNLINGHWICSVCNRKCD